MDFTDLKNLIKLLCAIANVGDEIGRDTAPARWSHLFELIQPVAAGAAIDFNKVKAELAALDASTRAQLEAELKADLNLGDKKLEVVIEDTIPLAEDLLGLFNDIKALKA